MGLLRVKGVLSLAQFWPEGKSDADTTQMIVNVDESAFEFSEYPGSPYRITQVFNDAKVKGIYGTTQVIKNGKIRVRLQGVDAPELHSRPQLPRGISRDDPRRAEFFEHNLDYRQRQAETSTKALADFLSQDSREELQCIMTTAVSEPNDVCDVFARMVGDLRLTIDGQAVVINQWLINEGWALPSFYVSMSRNEIRSLMDAARQARRRRGIWRYFVNQVGRFNSSMVFRGARVEINEEDDKGPFILPKLFRRQATHYALKKARIETGNLKSYLGRQGQDSFYETNDFLENGEHSATPYKFSDTLNSNGTLNKEPEEMVFREKKSTLIDANNHNIESWW